MRGPQIKWKKQEIFHVDLFLNYRTYLFRFLLGHVLLSLSTRVLEREVLLQDPESVIFVQALRDLKDVNTLAHVQTLDPNYRDIVMKLENSVNQLHEHKKMHLSYNIML